MLRYTRNPDSLLFLSGLGQNLYQDSYTAAVDVDISHHLQQYMARTLTIGIFISFLQVRFGKDRDINRLTTTFSDAILVLSYKLYTRIL